MNIGKFVDRSLSASTNLYPEIIWTDEVAFVYDRTTAGYYYVDNLSGSLSNFDYNLSTVENIDLIVNKSVEPVRMITAIPNDFRIAHGIALLKHKTLANTYYFSKISALSNNQVPFVYIKPLPAEVDILQPDITVMTPHSELNAVYYAKNKNELWVYTDSDLPVDQRQGRIFSYPADEIIADIKTLILKDLNLSWVYVLTNTTGGNYNLYVYNTQGANTALQFPEHIKLSGTGIAKAFYERFTSKN
jgi:hypothetical protein